MNILMLLSKSPDNDIRVQKEMAALREAGHTVDMLYFIQSMRGLKPWLVIRWSIQQSRRDLKVDAVHCHDLDTVLLGVLIKRRTGCKLIFDSHEYYLWTFKRFRDKLGYPYFWLLQRVAQRFVDVLIVISPTMQSYFENRYRFKKIVVVRNAQ